MHWIVALSALILAETSEAEKPRPDPISEYHQTNIRGWDVYVHKSLLREDEATGKAARELVDHQLYMITRRVPTEAVNRLRRIAIWLERDNDKHNPCACYHVSADWLEANGYLREKEKSVEICNAETFLKWSRDQPYMLLHELAHGYHDLTFGFDDARIEHAYQQAKESGKYESVLHIGGQRQKHYALENAKEYFAEATEAYFGTNDFYPFTRAELKEHDPEIYRLLEALWNDPQAEPAEEPDQSAEKPEDEDES